MKAFGAYEQGQGVGQRGNGYVVWFEELDKFY
jgi:hypothetical protein